MSSEHGTHLQVAVLRQKNLAPELGASFDSDHCFTAIRCKHRVIVWCGVIRPGPKAPEPHEDVVVAAATLINSDTLSRHMCC